MKIRLSILIALFVVIVAALLVRTPALDWVVIRMTGKKTLEERVTQYGQVARARLEPHFRNAGVRYPPSELIMVGLKHEKRLELYASDDVAQLRFIRSYPIKAASGRLGPKLKYGDAQVPEGIYRITFLNPNSSYHLSLRTDYPNQFDRKMAQMENRENLGSDIMIHGRSASIGCLAMGDEAAEDLFILVADTGIAHVKLILSPCDFRSSGPHPDLPSSPAWISVLYENIRSEMQSLPSTSSNHNATPDTASE